MIKVGIGQDSHRFVDGGKKLVLGGVKFIDDELFVSANSDGDVVLHSVCNALASAVGLGSIATYADKMCLEDGLDDSSEYVKYVFDKVKSSGYGVQNISSAIEAKQPKLEKYIPAMKKNIAGLLNIKESDVGITATSGEGLTVFGRGEGIQVISIVCLKKVS